ncbi:MAG: hypothetical protein Q9195_005660 [Heterodermia aff. obscurata]
MDELLSHWTPEIEDALRNDRTELFGAGAISAYDEGQAIAGAIDPDRTTTRPSQPLATEPRWFWEDVPVPHIPNLPASALIQDRQPESLFLTPYGSPAQAAAVLQNPDLQTMHTFGFSTDELPSLTTGAWAPTQFIAPPPPTVDALIDPSLRTLSTSSDSDSPQLTPLPTRKRKIPSSSNTTSPPAPRVPKRKRTTPPSTPPSKRLKPISPHLSLPAPLSILTASSPIPLKDTAAFVARSPATRHAEAAANHRCSNVIPRPMNSFMLYRSAYAERIVALVGTEKVSYQTVNKIAGQSWRMETAEVRGVFMGWQELDKRGHEVAWPGYKYEPRVKRGLGVLF